MKKQYVALIPAYKPDKILINLLTQLKAYNIDIIVVNDGSGPNYNNLFEQSESYAHVIHHQENKGKGCALITGLAYIKEKYKDDCVIVTLDADGQHAVSDALDVLELASRNYDALILGCRNFKKDVPLRSLLGNKITRLVFYISTGVKVSDTQTGLRAFDGNMIDYLLTIPGERYEYETNVLLEFAKNKKKIIEHTIKTIYYDNNSKSHFNTVKDSARIYGSIIKFASSSFISFLIDYVLYTLLIIFTRGLGTAISVPFSNITARIVSAGTNFTLNKKFVFKNNDSAIKTGALYFVLAAVILAGNTVLLSFMVEVLGVNKYIGKIVTEITFFILSWLAQKFIIFRKDKETNKGM